MTVAETCRALNIETEDFVYRLIRVGALSARKVNGKWDVDPVSVETRKRRVAVKRSSRSNDEAERARRLAEAEALFA